MLNENKTFIAIILGSVIIGWFVYLAVLKKSILVQDNLSDISGSVSKSQSSQNSKCQADENAIVTKVIDGDTIVVEGGYHVRLLGIDADEKNYPCHDLAKDRLEELVLNKQIILEKDKTDIDQYGRCLRTIFVEGENIGLQIVEEGLAVARFYQPDVKYKNEIAVAEKKAIKNKTGCKWNKGR